MEEGWPFQNIIENLNSVFDVAVKLNYNLEKRLQNFDQKIPSRIQFQALRIDYTT